MTAGLRVRLIGAFAAIYLMWGGTFLAIRYAVAEIPPLLTMVLRCGAGATLLLAWLAWRGDLERTSRAQWRTAALAGAFLFLGCHGLLAWAERRVTSGEAALFMTAIPLWLVALEWLLLHRAPSRRVLLGLALGVSGVAVLTAGERWAGGLVDRGALVVGALFWAVGTLIVRRGETPRSVTQSTAMQLGAGALVLLAASAAVGEGWGLAEVTPRAWLSLAFLVLGGTVVGFGAYIWLLRVTSAAAVSTYAFVNPVIALGLAWVVGDGELSLRTGAAAVLVVGAVMLIRERRARAGGLTTPAGTLDSVEARGAPVAPPGGRRPLGGLRAVPAGAAPLPAESRAPAGVVRGGE